MYQLSIQTQTCRFSIQRHVSSIFPADRCFIVSSRSRSSPVLRNRRVFCRPIEAKPGASSSWCWGVQRKRKILYKLKNSSLKGFAARLSGLPFRLSSECRVFRFSRNKRAKLKKKTAHSCSSQRQPIVIQQWYIHVPLHRKLAIA